jgi:uncharacterized membrane protein YccC
VREVWRNLIHYDAAKLTPWTALRNTIGVAVPFAVGAAFGSPASGLVAGTGALNVAFTDGSDPYVQRAERMVVASFVCAVAVVAGSFAGANHIEAVLLTLAWAFVAGMLVALDQTAADIGTISLVTLIVFAAHPLPLDQVFYSGLLALGGGLLQTGLAIALWPVRRFEPERRIIGSLYSELARSAAEPTQTSLAPPATSHVNDAQRALAGIGLLRNVQSQRFIFLLNQAERIRLSLLSLSRFRARLDREESAQPQARILEQSFENVARLLGSISASLQSDGHAESDSLRSLHELGEEIRKSGEVQPPGVAALLVDVVHAIDALNGQLRAAFELAGFATPSGRMVFEQRESRQPLRLRLLGAIPTLRANLTLESAACRHATRLAACAAVADGLARAEHWTRGYWLPMTAVIVLKPDFTSTFSRGLGRLAGTFAGLVISTALFHVLPVSFATEFSLIVIFTFLLRYVGPANYGILVTAVSALVVALVAVTGVAPNEVIAARGINTAIGGLLALGAYALWPTWERTQLRETMAQLIEAYRYYFHSIRESYLRPEDDFASELDRVRHTARLARSNLEASVDRFRAEPRASREDVNAWTSIMASSNRLIHAIMALEAGLARSQPVPPRPPFRRFANDVEITMHSLSSALRGSPLPNGQLPDLRADHHALVESGDSLSERYAMVNIESDRITNSLNTLSEQVVQLIEATPTTARLERDALSPRPG